MRIFASNMNAQELAVIGLFIVALVYVGRLLYRNFTAKSSCGSACKCPADFSEETPKKN